MGRMEVGGTAVVGGTLIGAPGGETAGMSPSTITGAVPWATLVATTVGIGSAIDSKTVPLPTAVADRRAVRNAWATEQGRATLGEHHAGS